MNIAMIHYRVGETDGVSLEMDKWKKILEKNGHKVYYIAGSEGTSKALIIKELFYRDEYDATLNSEIFGKLDKFNEEELQDKIIEQSKKIEEQFIKYFTDYKIDMVIPNNVLALGRSPHIAMGLTNAIKKVDVKVIGHHHDFYWEREYYANGTTSYANKLLEEYCPPIELDNMKHVVINKLAQIDLLEKKGLKSTIVPNVFDFEAEPWTEDNYNKTFKQDLGVTDNQLVFLQATRVTNRKAIELAIDLIALLNKAEYREKLIGKTLYNSKVFTKDTEIVLAMIGLHEGISGYEDKLVEHAKNKGVNLIVNPELVNHMRHYKNGKKVYSLWDAYVHCDMITYPSIYEGWGNQFLEGLFARKPQIVFEYSVFESDIKQYGFDYISLGNKYETMDNGLAILNKDVLDKAANETIEYLTNNAKYEDCVSKNFEIAKKELSLDALEKLVLSLI